MAKERHRIQSECPECGCGLVDNMTPDEFREKQSGSRQDTAGNSSKSGAGSDAGIPEQQTAEHNRS